MTDWYEVTLHNGDGRACGFIQVLARDGRHARELAEQELRSLGKGNPSLEAAWARMAALDRRP